MTSRGRRLASLIESCREIEVSVRLIGVHGYGFFPRIHGLFGMAESRGENSVIHQSIWIAREEVEHLPVALIRVAVPAVLQQSQTQGLLRAHIVRVDVHRALQRFN